MDMRKVDEKCVQTFMHLCKHEQENTTVMLIWVSFQTFPHIGKFQTRPNTSCSQLPPQNSRTLAMTLDRRDLSNETHRSDLSNEIHRSDLNCRPLASFKLKLFFAVL